MPVLTITPQLRTTDLDRSIRFYTELVGLELEFRHADFYAGIRSAGGSFHLKLVDTQDPSVEFVNEGGHLHLYLGVDDIDTFGERLRAAGIELIQPPCNTDWGTRELVFHDDQGHTIYAGTPVSPANKPPERTPGK
ncbi:MAG TPA: VOC family protein [Steroidobacteraceae bacterium]|nr:VOC family protein [Steroidobacteraceae bacterium]